MKRSFQMTGSLVHESASFQDEISGAVEGEFGSLYREYRLLVRSILFKMCGDKDLDDLVQETFLKIWKGLRKFRGECSIKTWICKIAYHSGVSYLRAERRAPFQESLNEASGTSAGQSPFTNLWLLRVALLELSDAHRDVIVLHFLEGLSIAEISEILQVPSGTVKSRLFHGKERLSSLLKARGVTSLVPFTSRRTGS